MASGCRIGGCRCLATAPSGCSSNNYVQSHYHARVSSQFTFASLSSAQTSDGRPLERVCTPDHRQRVASREKRSQSLDATARDAKIWKSRSEGSSRDQGRRLGLADFGERKTASGGPATRARAGSPTFDK